MNTFSNELLQLAKKYQIVLERSGNDNTGYTIATRLATGQGAWDISFTDDAWSRPPICGSTIKLGEFDDPDEELVAFYHELGHIYAKHDRQRLYPLCTLSEEGHAWEIGLNLAYSDGYKWGKDSKQQKFARAQLATYAS